MKSTLKYDPRFILDLFIPDDTVLKYGQLKPYKDCEEPNCIKGIVPTGYCPKCTRPFLLKEILSIPPRVNVSFSSPSYESEIVVKDGKNKKILMENTFVILKGSDLYIKLIAYDLAKEYLKQDKFVYAVDTKKFSTYEQVVDFSEETNKDFLAMKFADVIIFQDIIGKYSDFNYISMLKDRIDNDKKIIFLNEPEIINLRDSHGDISPDICSYTVDDVGIKIIPNSAK
jgi:hypothetical protein